MLQYISCGLLLDCVDYSGHPLDCLLDCFLNCGSLLDCVDYSGHPLDYSGHPLHCRNQRTSFYKTLFSDSTWSHVQ